jgi:hypothetical protein
MASKRISKELKAIADRHIDARCNDSFNYDNKNTNMTKQEVMAALSHGFTFRTIMGIIEVNFCTITSTLIARQFNNTTDKYRRDVYRGFKALYDELQSSK